MIEAPLLFEGAAPRAATRKIAMSSMADELSINRRIGWIHVAQSHVCMRVKAVERNIEQSIAVLAAASTNRPLNKMARVDE